MTDNERTEREQLCQNAMRLFLLTNRMHKRIANRRTASLGIHPSQHRMLMHLSSCKNTPSQREIAEHFDISSAAVAVTLKKLEKDGYIIKSKNADRYDSRFNEITITEKGKREAEETSEYFKYIDIHMFDNFNNYEIRDLIELLEKAKENLQIIDSRQSDITVDSVGERPNQTGKDYLS